MLPIYKAKKLIKVLEKGGHTKPWLIEIEVENSQNQVVVMKLYTTDQIRNRNSVTAEVIGNILAQEFDFLVPQALFVRATGQFYQSIPKSLQKLLLQRDERLKFGSFYLENTTKLVPNLPLNQLDSNLNLASLYAFDNFIRNADRGEQKTNLLIQNETSDIYLIDHELAFDFNKQTIQNFQHGNCEPRFSTYHFAFPFLDKNTDFSEFIEYLRTLNLNILNAYFDQLEELNFETQKDKIIPFLRWIKDHPNQFEQFLKNTLKK